MKWDVCVFGGASLDQSYYQCPDGSYDKEPNIVAFGGKGANQAVAASRAGAKTIFITKVGNDIIGESIINNLLVNKVDISNVEKINDASSDYSNIYINIKDKDNNIERHGNTTNEFDLDMIDKYKEVFLSSKIVVCQLKIPKEVTEKLINFCYENNKFLILTPCRPERLSIKDVENKKLIDKISIITCNRKECEILFGTSNIEECVSQYPNKLIVTLGEEGLIYHNGTRLVTMPAIPCAVLDTTGAGDTLNGNLSAFLAKGMDLQHALRKAMYASAMKLTKKTAQEGMPYLDELEKFISTTRNKKFEYQNELDFALEKVKSAYERIKYSNNIKVHIKIDNSIVTDADLAIEKHLIDAIKNRFPNDNFLTEENYPNNKLQNRTWIIDPIDGTSHFIKQDGMWGIQLAFFDKEATRFCIIYLPERDELYYAIKNNGAYLNNNKILKAEQSPLNQAVVEFGGSIYKEYDTKKLCLERLIKDNRLLVGNILHVNASCISYTNLVSGKTDGLIVATKSPWDIIPGEFLCQECEIKIRYVDFAQNVKILTKNKELKNLLLPEKR